jgi:hypothetical protein
VRERDGYISAGLLEDFEGFLDELAEVELLALAVIDGVADVDGLLLVQIEDGEDLAVVGDEGLSDVVGTGDELLQDLERDGDDLGVAGVEGG